MIGLFFFQSTIFYCLQNLLRYVEWKPQAGKLRAETDLYPNTHSTVRLKERQSDKLLNRTHDVTESAPPAHSTGIKHKSAICLRHSEEGTSIALYNLAI